jgi:hypothetical protein
VYACTGRNDRGQLEGERVMVSLDPTGRFSIDLDHSEVTT